MQDVLDRETDAQGQALRAAREANREVTKRFNKRSIEASNHAIKEAFGVDMEKINFRDPFFSIKKFQEAAHRGAREGRFRETNPESAFSALLRAGINNLANQWYDLQPTTFDSIVAVVPSTHAVEPFAPMHRGGLPRKTPVGMPSPEVRNFAPLDIQLLNEKYTAIASIPEELIKWDQTAQAISRVQDIGPNMAQYEDALFAARFYQLSTASTTILGGDVVTGSNTKPSNETTWPWSTAFVGGGSNILSAYATFSQDVLQKLDNILYQQKDLAGNYLVVTPDTLLVGTGLRFPAQTLLNSAWYPATVAENVGVSGGASTNIGTTFAQNVMKGLYRLVVNRYLPTKAYAIGMAQRGMVETVASGLEVVQENPMAGDSFNQGEFRYKAKKFFAMDWIDPRFWAQGNDGSV